MNGERRMHRRLLLSLYAVLVLAPLPVEAVTTETAKVTVYPLNSTSPNDLVLGPTPTGTVTKFPLDGVDSLVAGEDGRLWYTAIDVSLGECRG